MADLFRQKINKKSSSAIIFAGGAFTLVALVGASTWLTEKPDRLRKPLPAITLTPAPVAAASTVNQKNPFRLVYRHSVIPGGVHNAAELAAAVQGDPVIQAHYVNFDVAAAHAVQLEQSRLVHVSYRIGEQIYWTKHAVRLALGEELLSDGTHLVRARCGNRIADEPEGPVLDNEPASGVLDAAFVSAESLIGSPANMAAVNTGVALAPAVNAATAAIVATAATAAAQAFDASVTSNWQSGAQFASIGLQNGAGQRTAAQFASVSAQLGNTVSFAPALIDRFDPATLNTSRTSGTPATNGTLSVTSGGGASPAPMPTDPALPHNLQSVSPVHEPGSAVLFGLAWMILMLGWHRAKRQRRS